MPCAKKPKVNWLDKARFISHYAVDGCSTNLKVYVETFAQADTNLVLGLVNTSPEDFTRFLLRPKGARTERHGISSMSRNEAAAEDELIPDTAKLAADTIHDLTGWHVPTWGELGDALFEVAKPFWRGAYYLILANVTEDFAFDWYSGILLAPSSKCDIGRFRGEGGDVAVHSTDYQVIHAGAIDYDPINAEFTVLGLKLLEGTWCVIIHLTAHRQFFPDPAVQLFAKLMVGDAGDSQCGGDMVLDCPVGDFQITKKFVRKVSAPDLLNVQISVHVAAATSHDIDYGILIEGFRLS